MVDFDFRAVREEYACHAQSGPAAYRRERRYVLSQLAWHRRHGRTSSYYRHALAGLRQLGLEG